MLNARFEEDMCTCILFQIVIVLISVSVPCHGGWLRVFSPEASQLNCARTWMPLAAAEDNRLEVKVSDNSPSSLLDTKGEGPVDSVQVGLHIR